MPKTYEYEEGKQAQKNFEQGMKALFQVPASEVPSKKKARKKRAMLTKLEPQRSFLEMLSAALRAQKPSLEISLHSPELESGISRWQTAAS